MIVLINGEAYSTKKNRIWAEIHGNREYKYGSLPFSAKVELLQGNLIKPKPVLIVTTSSLACEKPEFDGNTWRFPLSEPIRYFDAGIFTGTEEGIITAIHIEGK